MHLIFKKYKTLFLLKASLLAGLLLFTIAGIAQEDTVRLERLSDRDTTIVAIDEYNEDEEGEEDEDDDDENIKEEYFVLKSNYFGEDTFALRSINDSVLQAYKKDKDFWYADKTFIKKTTNEGVSLPFWLQPGFQLFLWLVIIAAFVGFLILYLKEGSVSLFRKSKNIDASLEEENHQNIFEINYQREIDKAIQSGDYRLAVRLLYLRVIKKLSDRNLIKYTQDKTNFDYLMEVSSTKWYDSFFRITRHYEYSWYGQFEVSSEAFTLIQKEFDNFEKQL